MATFGQGKISLVKYLKQCDEIQDISQLMMNRDITTEQIREASARLFVIMYGGKETDCLSALLVCHYCAYEHMTSYIYVYIVRETSLSDTGIA